MKSKKLLSIMAFIGMGLVSSAYADFDMKAGPIFSQNEAQAKCTKACTLAWNSGAWVTKVQGKMSICSGVNAAADGNKYVTMDNAGGVEAGPIFGNNEAQAKCTAALAKVKWNGQWKTTVEGKMSVCGCTGTMVPWTPNVIDK